MTDWTGSRNVYLKGNCAPNFSSSYSQASARKIFLAETQSQYDNGKLLFFRRNVLQVGGRSPPFLTSSVTSVFTSHCTVRVLYAYFMCEEAAKDAVVPVQKMLRWPLPFSRMREQPSGQGLCSYHLLLPVVRAKLLFAHVWRMRRILGI